MHVYMYTKHSYLLFTTSCAYVHVSSFQHLSHIGMNMATQYTVEPHSIEYTIGAQLAVLYRERCPLFRDRFVYSSLWLGLQTVSSSERCPLFRGRFVHSSMWLGLQTVSSLERCTRFKVSSIERLHYTCMYYST